MSTKPVRRCPVTKLTQRQIRYLALAAQTRCGMLAIGRRASACADRSLFSAYLRQTISRRMRVSMSRRGRAWRPTGAQPTVQEWVISVTLAAN